MTDGRRVLFEMQQPERAPETFLSRLQHLDFLPEIGGSGDTSNQKKFSLSLFVPKKQRHVLLFGDGTNLMLFPSKFKSNSG